MKGFKGEYYVLDKKAGKFLSIPVYPAPNDKGGFSTHATPTVDGNVLVGPDSYVTEDREDYVVTKEHMDGLFRDGSKMFKQMKREYFIRNFAGIRWKRYNPETGEILDFLLESDDAHPHTVNLVGIESPGVTCALPLARRAVALLVKKEQPQKNENFDPVRPVKKRFHEMSHEEQMAAIKENPLYGEVVCRCETVTKAEILDAIRNPLGVCTVTGIKNRTRATMGRCQGRLLRDPYHRDDRAGEASCSGRSTLLQTGFLYFHRKGQGRKMRNVDVVIIGGGPAGLAAALELWKKGIHDILILEREKDWAASCASVFTMALA